GSWPSALEPDVVGARGERPEDPGVQHPTTSMSFSHRGVRPEPGPRTGADLDLRPGQVDVGVHHQRTGVGADVEHHAGLATRAQGPLGPRAAVVVVAGAHRQLAGTKKPLWGTPR